ncbi:MAG: CHAT domain-containing protein [Planctomycetes bacterium]|nr:CHAT domain-containing protein [Planctomycetota bacterium]
MVPTALVLVALAAPPATPAESFRRAEELYAVDRFGEAEPLYKAALESEEPFLRRRVYTRLMNLYARSGRPDKAIKLAEPYRAWLKSVNDPDALAALDLLTGECLHELGYSADADKHLVAALDSKLLPAGGKLEALRLRAEVAARRRDAAENERWADLEKEAAEASKRAVRVSDAAARVVAGRYLAEALFRRGDTDGALAALAEFPDLHDKLEDPLGRRDTQRQRAKLLAAKGNYADAAPLFKEALELHRKHQPRRRLVAGDILAEWTTAALTQGSTTLGRAEVARLRDRAAAEYRAALDSPADNPDAGGPLAALVRLQALTRQARQFAQALDVTVTAGERWENDPLVDGRLKSDRGGLELMTSAYKTARTSLAQALADLDASDPPNLRVLPMVLVNLATAELALGDSDKATTLLVRCTELYRKHKLAPDPVRAECDYLTGVAATRRGDFAQAMAHFRAGLALCDTVGRAADPVRFNLWLNVALIHKEQGDAAAAGDALKKAADVLAGLVEPDDLSAALIDAVRADLFLARGQVAPALPLAARLEAACAKYGYRSGYLWATAKHVRALDLLTRKDAPAAEAVWLELAEAQRKEKHVLLARTLNFLGVCAELRGKDADAAKLFEEARAFQADRPRCPPVTRGITLWRLAVLTDKAGQKAEAKALLNEVFDVADRARLNTFGAAAQRAQFFAQFAPAFEQLASWCARDNDGEALLRAAVRSRSRTLLDQMLAAGVDPRDRLTGAAGARLLKREAEARRSVSRLRAKAMLVTAAAGNDPDAKKVLAELESAQKEYTDAWREIANADPLTRVLTDPAFGEAALAQARKEAQKSGGVLLAYLIGRDESFAVLSTDPAVPPQVFRLSVARPVADTIGDAPAADAVTRAGFRGVTVKPTGKQPDRPAAAPVELVPLTDVVTGRLVNQYLRYVADPAFSPTRGINLVSRTPNVARPSAPEILGDAVLPAALRDKIRAAGAKRVVLIPDGALHKLPFECLLLSATPNPKYALDELPPVCYMPSIAALAVVLNRPRALDGETSLLTVGDPAYPEAGASALPRLPFTAVESKRVRQSFPEDRVTALEGPNATEANVTGAMPGKRFIHLAAHGFADEQFGNAFAAVALTPPSKGTEEPGNDGFLTLHEITRLKLTGCELTVLSACVTNVGPQRPMEAGVTLAGAFLGAGSRGVMASCWSVDDRATAELMGAFFGAVRPADGKGAPYPEALKAARVAVKGKPGWEAPFYWAPFVYVGPPD